MPSIGSDSWVRLLNVGRSRTLVHCRVSLARSARQPIRPQSDLSLLDDTKSSSVQLEVAINKSSPQIFGLDLFTDLLHGHAKVFILEGIYQNKFSIVRREILMESILVDCVSIITDRLGCVSEP